MSANLAVFLKYGVNLEIIASPHGEAMIFIDSVQNHHKNLECKKKKHIMRVSLEIAKETNYE